MKDTHLIRLVTTVLPASLIDEIASECGAFKRQRKIWLAPLVWVLVLGSLCVPHGSIADFHRLYCVQMGARLARSSFYERLTPQLASLISRLLTRALRANRRCIPHWLCGHTEFDDVVAVDSSVVALRDGMRSTFEACAKASAALKVHAVVSVLDFLPHRVRLSSQTEHDRIGLRDVRQWCRGKLLMMDLGYYNFAVFAAIQECGGSFISRAKTGIACRIVQDHARGSGAFASLKGLKLKHALRHIKRGVLDVDVELVFTRGGTRRTKVMRAVGLWNEERGRYHVYVTNLDRQHYPAPEIGQLYRMRWGVELLWKQLKSDGLLDVHTSAKEHIVRLRIDSALLAYCITGRLCATLQRGEPDRPYPVARGVRALGALGPRLLDELCRPWRGAVSLGELFEWMTRDPNDFRERAWDPLLRTSDLQWVTQSADISL